MSKLPTALVATLCAFLCLPAVLEAGKLTLLERLGKEIFFDKNLSSPAGQSCASCHAPNTGFTSPDSAVNAQGAVDPGTIRERSGNRKPPAVAYAAYSPPFHYEAKDETWVGGLFWDGRARSLTDQAMKPLLNPVEMNNASSREVMDKMTKASYRPLFEKVFGAQALDSRVRDPDQVLEFVGQAIAAYESSTEINPFSSKYDAFLAGEVKLTATEQRGLTLYAGKANCKACHPHEPNEEGLAPLFTDYTYDNLGVPKNPKNPFYQQPKTVNTEGAAYIDPGIGAIVNDNAHRGKFKVPTLRNIDLRPSPEFVKAYFHNGAMKSLKEVVHFYNARDTDPHAFGPPEFPDTMNKAELGHQKMTDEEENDLVAFLKTLSDGYVAPAAVPPSVPQEEPPIAGPQPDAPASVESPDAIGPILHRDAAGFRAASDFRRIQAFRRHPHHATSQPSERR